MLKKIIPAVVICSALALPALASAKSLTIVNGTRKAFSVNINGHCSSVIGYIQPGQNREVSESILGKLCGVNQTACQGEVHNASHCAGETIAKFGFDVKQGLSGHFITINPYKVTINAPQNVFVLYEEVK